MHNGHVSVKEAVLPFARFAGADSVLGPEMKSTGEVMGIAARLPDRLRQGAGGGRGLAARARAPSSSPSPTPTRPPRPSSRRASTTSASRSSPPRGTAQAISRMGIPVRAINKIGEGSPHVVDCIRDGEVDLVINTPTGSGARTDGYEIRTAAVRQGIPCITTMTGASAAARAIVARREGERRAGLPAGAARAIEHAPSAARRARDGADRPASLAPFGRRRLRGRRQRRDRRLPDLLGARPRRARAARRGSSTCSPRERLGRGRGAARSCRAPSRSPTREPSARRRRA